MKLPPLLPHETRRLQRLRSLDILDTAPEDSFDEYAQLAAHIAGTPMALVTFVDEARQWFKARVGYEATESSRDISFCAHAIAEPRPLVVDDATADPRFAGNPGVTGEPGVRFYAGFPLRSGDGHALGTLCVFDRTPHTLSAAQFAALEKLAHRVEAELELRAAVSDLESTSAPAPITEVCATCAHDVRGHSRCPRCKRPVPDPRYLGKRIGERFDILRLAGMGGIAQVYAATDLRTGAEVAVKLLLPRWELDREMRERLEREGAALARVHHPSIVAAIDQGVHDNMPYLAVELISGRPLADEIFDHQNPLPLEQAIRVMGEVGGALRAAHAAGVVHRDLKPENVILLPTPVTKIKLIDFGLAIMPDRGDLPRLTSANVVQGTPHYMAPERCRGGDSGPPADIYSAGVMLYELVTGVAPFTGSSPADIMTGHLHRDPPPMAEVGARRPVPEPIVRVVRAALSKDPALRPTADEFVTELCGSPAPAAAHPAPKPGLVGRIQRLFAR